MKANIRFGTFLVCLIFLLSGCEMSTSTPEPCTPGPTLPLSCMDAYMFIIEGHDIASVTLNLTYEGQQVSEEAVQVVTCNDMQLERTVVGFMANIPVSDGDINYDCEIKGNEQEATLLIFSTIKPEIKSPIEDESIPCNQDITISYDPGVFRESEWIHGGASLYVDDKLVMSQEGEYQEEKNYQYRYQLELNGFVPGTGDVWFNRKIIEEIPYLYHIGIHSLMLEYSAIDVVHVVWE